MSVTQIKKVAAIHDLSGFGRCSLTVITPVLSAMGIQVCPVPTALLSTHTGGFENIVVRDMSDYIKPCYEHYKSLGIKFDAVYSGFLASASQIDDCLEFFRGYPGALKVVDPVMGDEGKPYKTYTKELCERMGELVGVADIITPNVTEAAILLGEDYVPVFTPALAEDWGARLCEKSETVVITGVVIEDKFFNVGFSREGLVWVSYNHIPEHYPGTGDIFASVLTGAILSSGGGNLQKAIERATEFAVTAVETTYNSGLGGDTRNGVMFEGLLGMLNPNTAPD